MIVVDTIEKFERLKEGVKKTPFLYLQIYSDVNKHPLENKVSCYYILSPTGNEYIVPVNHIESVKFFSSYLARYVSGYRVTNTNQV